MGVLFQRADEDILETLRSLDFDPFAPILLINPITGFPKTVDAETGIGDATVKLDARDRLTRFEIDDNDKKLDVVRITFIDEEGFFGDPNQLAHGSVIDIAWGYKGLMSQPRRLIVRRLQLQALQGKARVGRRRGFLVNLEGLAPGVVGLADEGASVDLFENKRISTIARILGEKLGYHEEARGERNLTINIPPSDDFVETSLQKPAAQKLSQFMKSLADRYGMLASWGKTGLYFGIRDFDATPAKAIDFNDGLLLSYDLDGDLSLGIPKGLKLVGMRKGTWAEGTLQKTTDGDDPLAFNNDIASTENEASAEAEPHDTDIIEAPPEPSLQRQQADANSAIVSGSAVFELQKPIRASQALKRRHVVMEDFRPTTDAKMRAQALRRFTNRINKMWRLKLRIVGHPEFISGITIELRNFDTPLIDGTWYVLQAKHTFDREYITELVCRRRRDTRKRVGQDHIEGKLQRVPREESDKPLDFDSDGSYEGGIIIEDVAKARRLLNLPQPKTAHRTESGNFATRTLKRRGHKPGGSV
jgi:phage protein D